MFRENKFTIAMIAFTVIFLVGLFYLASKKDSVSVSGSDTKLLTVQPDDWIKGNPDAKLTLIEYLDFECEACGAYYSLIKQISEDFKDDVRFVVRYFPNPGHANAMTAAVAVEAAGKQGKFWEMHDLLFEKQKEWGEKQQPTPAVFEAFAEQLGLDMVAFKADVEDAHVQERVKRDLNNGIKLGVQGTPTFFLEDEKVQIRSYEEFKNKIEVALNR